jgi:hypothetical protein
MKSDELVFVLTRYDTLLMEGGDRDFARQSVRQAIAVKAKPTQHQR